MTRALSTVPNTLGRFGPYGGRYVPETLMPALEQLELALGPEEAKNDEERKHQMISKHRAQMM